MAVMEDEEREGTSRAFVGHNCGLYGLDMKKRGRKREEKQEAKVGYGPQSRTRLVFEGTRSR
jgi:hypothetical protein